MLGGQPVVDQVNGGAGGDGDLGRDSAMGAERAADVGTAVEIEDGPVLVRALGGDQVAPDATESAGGDA